MRILHISGDRPLYTERRKHPKAESGIAEDVYLDGELIGTVIYVRQRHKAGGSTYGWRRAEASSRTAVLTKAEAINQLLRRLDTATTQE